MSKKRMTLNFFFPTIQLQVVTHTKGDYSYYSSKLFLMIVIDWCGCIFFLLLENGIQVAEVGCGTGLLARQLITMFPRSHFTLTDMMPEPLERCRKLAQAEGLTNFTVHTLDVCNVPQDWNERFDWIFAQNVIHDLPYPQRAVQGIQRALRPGGYFSMVDIYGESYLANNVGNTEAAALYAFSALLCLPESFQKSDSEALGACWGKQRATKIITGAGLKLLSVTKPPNLSTIAVFTCQK